MPLSPVVQPPLLLGGLTAGRIPVGTSPLTIGNSNFTASGTVLDLAAAGTLFLGNGVATAVSIGSLNIVTYLGGTSPSTGSTGSVHVVNPMYSIGPNASSGAQLINSPFHYFQSNYWTGSASSTLYGGIRMVPSSTVPHGYIQFNIGPSGLSEVGRIDDLGTFYALPGAGFDVMGAGALNVGATNATSIAIGSSSSATTVLQGTSPSIVSTAAANGAFPFSNTVNAFTGGSAIYAFKTGGTSVATVAANGAFQSANGTYEPMTSGVQLNLGTGVAGNIRIGAPANTTTIATNTIVIGDATATTRTMFGGFQAATGSGITTGQWTLTGATGAASDGTTTAGAAGQAIRIKGGTGGIGSGAFAPGAGSPVILVAGDAGGTGNANGGNISVDGGAGSGTGTGGIVLLGNAATTSSITIGRSGLPSGITMLTGGGGLAVIGNITNTGSFAPEADATRNIGASGTRYSSIFGLTFSAGSSGLTLSGASQTFVFNASGFDVGAAGALNVGGINATSLNVGKSGITTKILGSLGCVTQSVTGTTSTTINPASGGVCLLNLVSATNVTTLTISAGVDGQELVLLIVQPASGTAATVATTWTNTSLAGGSLTNTATLGKRDAVTLVYVAATSKWYERSRALNLAN